MNLEDELIYIKRRLDELEKRRKSYWIKVQQIGRETTGSPKYMIYITGICKELGLDNSQEVEIVVLSHRDKVRNVVKPKIDDIGVRSVGE